MQFYLRYVDDYYIWTKPLQGENSFELTLRRRSGLYYTLVSPYCQLSIRVFYTIEIVYYFSYNFSFLASFSVRFRFSIYSFPLYRISVFLLGVFSQFIQFFTSSLLYRLSFSTLDSFFFLQELLVFSFSFVLSFSLDLVLGLVFLLSYLDILVRLRSYYYIRPLYVTLSRSCY